MFPTEILITYLAAVLLVVISPGPDNILAISRGLSQGLLAGTLSAIGAGLGIMCHTVAAALGLALLLQTSPLAFWVVKAVGAAYLIWLGYKAITARNLVSFLPQFSSPSRGSVPLQILVYGAIFAFLTAAIFAILAGFAAQLSAWLSRRPKVVAGLNVGAGLTFITAGLSILALGRRGEA
jgi:threonine/homoserine/homoserine lactone efflux protein